MSAPRKYESVGQKGLFYWAETTDPEGILKGPTTYMVVAQAKGFPATEAHDDWFADFKVADQLAKDMAAGKNVE